MEKVKIYTAPSSTCRQVKEFLAGRGVEFDSYDISRDMNAFLEMMKISKGVKTVPVISVFGQVMVGYDRAKLEKALSSMPAES